MSKVAIIGAGASGLVSIKACLEEGMEPTCFEKSTAIGGLWRYRDSDKFQNLACVYKSTVINTSKEIMAFSDFPPPKDYPNYMHNSQVYEYFKMYAANFDLMNKIQFNTSVVSVRRADDQSELGKWSVIVRNEVDGTERSEIFDAVMVCTGHHAIPHSPDFEGLGQFQGVKIHTHDYRKAAPFEDQRVLVVGIGNSAGDAAVDLSHVASKVYLSTRRGAWLMPRTGEAGLPGDLKFSRAFLLFPSGMVNSVVEKQLQRFVDHDLYGLRPSHRPMSAHPTVNDSLPNRIANGSVIIKPNVKCFTENGVQFEDDSFEAIDAVVFGTGYKIEFPFLPEEILSVHQNEVSLYKYVFPPTLNSPSLAIIGLVQPIGSTIPIAEIQSRWATRVFKGLAALPSKKTMLADIKRKKEAMKKRYVSSQRHTIQVDYLPYMDEIANEFGVKPNFWKMFLKDPKFWAKNIFGPSFSYQFRLEGPGKWAGAKEAIETYWERVEAPFHTRQVPPSGPKEEGRSRKWLIIPLVILLISSWKLTRSHTISTETIRDIVRCKGLPHYW